MAVYPQSKTLNMQPDMFDQKRPFLHPPVPPTEEGLRSLLDTLPRLTPNRDTWDIEGHWEVPVVPIQPRSVDLTDKQSRLELRDPSTQVFTPQYLQQVAESSIIGSQPGEMIFLSDQYMHQFALFSGVSMNTIKLVNLFKPACKLSFYTKHVYKLQKGLDEVEKREAIDMHIVNITSLKEELLHQLATSSPNRRSSLQNQIMALGEEETRWKVIRHKAESWELTISNYETGYAYLWVNIKYRQKEVYDNFAVHLLHNLRDKVGKTVENRYNVIFINEDEIYREHAMQNKQIEHYLNSFPVKSSALAGKRFRLYARKKE